MQADGGEQEPSVAAVLTGGDADQQTFRKGPGGGGVTFRTGKAEIEQRLTRSA